MAPCPKLPALVSTVSEPFTRSPRRRHRVFCGVSPIAKISNCFASTRHPLNEHAGRCLYPFCTAQSRASSLPSRPQRLGGFGYLVPLLLNGASRQADLENNIVGFIVSFLLRQSVSGFFRRLASRMQKVYPFPHPWFSGSILAAQPSSFQV